MEFTNAGLENFARGTEVFMAMLDEEGMFKKANIRWTQRFDYTLDKLIGTPVFNLIHELEVGEFEITLNHVKKEGQVCHCIVTMIGRELQAHSFQFDLTYTNRDIYLVGFDVTDHAREHLSLIDMSRLSKTGAWYMIRYVTKPFGPMKYIVSTSCNLAVRWMQNRHCNSTPKTIKRRSNSW